MGRAGQVATVTFAHLTDAGRVHAATRLAVDTLRDAYYDAERPEGLPEALRSGVPGERARGPDNITLQLIRFGAQRRLPAALLSLRVW